MTSEKGIESDFLAKLQILHATEYSDPAYLIGRMNWRALLEIGNTSTGWKPAIGVNDFSRGC